MQLRRNLRELRNRIEDVQDSDDRQYFRAELQDLYNQSGHYLEGSKYVAFTERKLGQAERIRAGDGPPADDPVSDPARLADAASVREVDWREIPLCGCGSPTCDAKRGELPTACRDRTNGLLDQRSAPERIETYLQTHTQPTALRVIHHAWASGYHDLLVRSEELIAECEAAYEIPSAGVAPSDD